MKSSTLALCLLALATLYCAFPGADSVCAQTNTALGTGALASPSTNMLDASAFGFNALHSPTSGDHNTAVGSQALFSNTTGFHNTASGANALGTNTTGFLNTASGYAALQDNSTGVLNTASGARALLNNNTGA